MAVNKEHDYTIPATGFVNNGDVWIHYRVSGKGPAMIFCHGFPDNEETWSKQVAEFSKDHMVFTPTLRGYPPSSIPDHVDKYDMEVSATDHLAILEHFGLEKAVFVGHDFGGGIAQAFAIMFPDKVAGLIIINSPILGPFFELTKYDEEQLVLSEYTKAYIEYQSGDDKNVDYVVRNIRDDEHRAQVSKYLTENSIHGMFNHYKKVWPQPPYTDDVDTSIFVFHVPCLVLWGLEEEYFSLKFLNSLHKWFKESVRLVTIPGAGHWAFRDKPELVNSEIRSWITTKGF